MRLRSVTNLNRILITDVESLQKALLWMITSTKLFQKYEEKYHSDSNFILRFMAASMWLLINRFHGKAYKFFENIKYNFYMIPPSNASFNAVLHKYLFTIKSVQSVLTINRCEYYLEKLLVSMFSVISETHSAISWKLGQDWNRLNISHHFLRYNGDVREYLLSLPPLIELFVMNEINEVCEDSMID